MGTHVTECVTVCQRGACNLIFVKEISLDSNGVNFKLQSLQTADLVKSWKNFTLAMKVFLFIVVVVTA